MLSFDAVGERARVRAEIAKQKQHTLVIIADERQPRPCAGGDCCCSRFHWRANGRRMYSASRRGVRWRSSLAVEGPTALGQKATPLAKRMALYTLGQPTAAELAGFVRTAGLRRLDVPESALRRLEGLGSSVRRQPDAPRPKEMVRRELGSVYVLRASLFYPNSLGGAA